VWLGLLKAYWVHLVVAGVVLGFTVAVYHEGGRAPRAELAKVLAEVKAAKEAREAKDALDQATAKEEATRRDAERDARIARINATWDGIVAGLRGDNAKLLYDRARIRKENESIRITAKICNDEAANNRLSDAVSSFAQEARSALGECRAAAQEFAAETAGLLKPAEAQTGDLVDVQAWVESQRKLWNEQGP